VLSSEFEGPSSTTATSLAAPSPSGGLLSSRVRLANGIPHPYIPVEFNESTYLVQFLTYHQRRGALHLACLLRLHWRCPQQALLEVGPEVEVDVSCIKEYW
jgi:hypothetical protein